MKYSLYNDDCLIKLKDLEDNSIDSCITDPPYGLSFMGHKWDYDVPKVEIWKEIYRVLKPGSYCLSFFGSRTYHRGVINIEDAGFEIRDQIMWIYGSGFPKSFNVDKAISKQLNIDSSEYKGLGTALKPAHEPIVMARKPLSESSIVKNIVKHGTGAINIDDCRVPVDGEYITPTIREYNHNMEGWSRPWQQNEELVKNMKEEAYNKLNNIGRFPANVIHDGSEEVINTFPNSTQFSGRLNPREYNKDTEIYNKYKYKSGNIPRNDKTKNVSRFFYCAKASKHDRDEGLTIEEYYILNENTSQELIDKISNMLSTSIVTDGVSSKCRPPIKKEK